MNRKYSVLMAVYFKERPEYLDESIKSMIGQTLKPDEIVLVKDGPLTVELDQVISKYLIEEPKLFNIVFLNNNVGLGKALDEGLKLCKNELVARMDTDDISLPERCEMQIDMFIEKPQLSIVGTMIGEFYDNPNIVLTTRKVPLSNEEISNFIKRRSPFNHPTVMYKKADVIKCGGYGDFRLKQDLDLFSRMINRGYLAANINKTLLLFRSNADSYKRRKSWPYCKSYIDVQYAIWRRGHCSFIDLLFVTFSQLIIFFMPMLLYKKVSNRFLRVKKT